MSEEAPQKFQRLHLYSPSNKKLSGKGVRYVELSLHDIDQIELDLLRAEPDINRLSLNKKETDAILETSIRFVTTERVPLHVVVDVPEKDGKPAVQHLEPDWDKAILEARQRDGAEDQEERDLQDGRPDCPSERLRRRVQREPAGHGRDPAGKSDGARGVGGLYWEQRWNRTKQVAMACRYGHQNYFDILGRDPVRQPMTALELALFNWALKEFWENEHEAPDPTTEDSED